MKLIRNTSSMTIDLRPRRSDPGGVKEGSQGVNCRVPAGHLNPGQSVNVLSPRSSSAPVVTTASLNWTLSATPFGVGRKEAKSRGLRHPGYRLGPSGSEGIGLGEES
jgi:hypothetical protein